jgi:Methane oxygenase PmoA
MHRLFVLLASFVLPFVPPAAAATFTAEKTDRGVTVKVDGQLFTEYLIRSGVKPILWPIIGPTGKPMTRDWPMVEGKKQDHPHQRSLWFDHGDVNGVSFWEETRKAGSIRHRDFVEVRGGPDARIVTRNDWITPDDKKMCEDERTFVFRIDGDQRLIDFSVIVTASEGPIKFGDTKEGSFGMRVPTSMTVDAKQGGRIVTSEGLTDAAAWGQPASWVDYHGPVDSEQLGIAILNHPSSLRYPNRWHVRPYGLFAANPFGKEGKTGFEATSGPGGPYSFDRGQSFTLRYRVILHRGDEKSAKIADAFAAYAKEDFSDKPRPK